MKAHVKSWGSLTFVIFVLSVVAAVTATRLSFLTIFAGIFFIVGIPILWDKYGKEAILIKFWGGIAKNGVNVLASIFIYFLIRSYASYLVDFAPFESYVSFRQNSGMVAFLGITPPKVLFEGSFLILIGLMVLHAVYNRSKPARFGVGSILALCMLMQIFYFSAGPTVVQAATAPLSKTNMVKAVQDNGAIGGTTKSLWRAGFGGNEGKSGSITITQEYLLPGKQYRYVVEAAESTPWLESATPYDIEAHCEYYILNTTGEVFGPNDKDRWPIGEPFRVVPLTRQNLGIFPS